MSPKPNDDLDLFAALKARADRHAAETLAAAKAHAATTSKEPFDYARLEGMCQTLSDATMRMSDAERAQYFEELYCVGYPRVVSLAEFAGKVNELAQLM